jgi:predicted phosphoribosyltransferase
MTIQNDVGATQGVVVKLATEADEVSFVTNPREMFRIASYYKNYPYVSDDEILFYLEKYRNEYR